MINETPDDVLSANAVVDYRIDRIHRRSIDPSERQILVDLFRNGEPANGQRSVSSTG